MSRRATIPAGDPLLERIDALVGKLTELTETTRSNVLNHVLWSGTKVIPAEGYVTLEHSIPMATVAVGALAAAGTVTLAASPPAGSAPTEGPGVHVVPPGWHLVTPLTGAVLTLYGTPGDTVEVVCLTRLMPPSAGGGGANGGTP